jgi:photosystem II stability/assembly factor-like uncharacterized protein
MHLGRFLTVLILATGATALLAQESGPRPAEPARLAAQSLLLDVTRAGQRYVAVGERGHVLLSGDGENWEQAESVPVRSTLTRVAFAGGRLWAVGHDSSIIHSRDLGRTWTLQHFDPEAEEPLLDVHFLDANRGIAIGAYGLYMWTENAGDDWETVDMADLVTSEDIDWAAMAAEQAEDLVMDMEAMQDELSEDGEPVVDRGCYEFMECHLNAFLETGDGEWLIAAERGYGFRSSDQGQTWESFRFPYPGSMFGLLQVDGQILAYGLRGHVQVSTDNGRRWVELATGLNSTLKGGAVDPQGRALMVGAGAAQLVFDPETRDFELQEDRLGSTYASVLFADDGRKILVGEDGVSHD